MAPPSLESAASADLAAEASEPICPASPATSLTHPAIFPKNSFPVRRVSALATLSTAVTVLSNSSHQLFVSSLASSISSLAAFTASSLNSFMAGVTSVESR